MSVRLRDVASNPTTRSSGRILPYLALEHVEANAGGLSSDVEIGDLSRDDAVLARSGDVLFGKLRPYLSKVVYVEEDLHCSSELLVLRPSTGVLDSRFLYYLALSKPFTSWAISTSVGVKMPRTDWPALSLFKLDDIPSLDQQQKISRFLDQEIDSLSRLAQEQGRQRALLAERKSALITTALSGGFSSNRDLIDSGVPWIGLIPSDWEVMRLKHLGRASIGLTYSPADVVDDPSEGTLVLRSGNIQNGRISLEDNVYVRASVPTHLRTQSGDILICVRNGSVRLIGKSAVITEEMAGVTWGAFMSVFRSSMNGYLSWVFRSSIFSQQLGLFATSTINQLTNATLHNFQVPVPPEKERGTLTRILEDECGRIDDLTAELDRSAELLNERKTAIITAAVTGQMEVA